MSVEDNSTYCSRRARQEWKAAENATDMAAATAHAKMARDYEARAAGHRVDEMILRVVPD